VGHPDGDDVARSLAFYHRSIVQTLFWLRMPGDVLVIVGAVLYLLATVKALFAQRRPASSDATVSGQDVPADD
jgi:nitric oxide reductase subunit B